jgi:hypothetical protein
MAQCACTEVRVASAPLPLPLDMDCTGHGPGTGWHVSSRTPDPTSCATPCTEDIEELAESKGHVVYWDSLSYGQCPVHAYDVPPGRVDMDAVQ